MRKQVCFLLFFFWCGFGNQTSAQDLVDSILNIGKKVTQSDATRTNTSSSDTIFNALIKRVDYYADKFNTINSQLNADFDTLQIHEELPQIESRLKSTSEFSFDGNRITLRSLSTFQDYFATTQKQLDKWEKQLSLYNSSLTQMQEVLCGLTTDSVFKNLPADSALRNQFFIRLNSLGAKWHQLDSVSNKAILKLGFLQNRISAAQLQIIDFNEEIKVGLKKLSNRTFSKEYDYLWDIQLTDFFTELKESTFRTIAVNLRILYYYLKYSYKVHIINFLLFLILFFWISGNRNKILKEYQSASAIFEHAILIARYPIVAALAVTATVGPFFYYHPPIFLTELYLVLLMVCIGILMFKNYQKHLISGWLMMIVFVILFSIHNLYFQVFESERLVFFILTAIILIYCLNFYKKHIAEVPKQYKNKVKYLSYIFFFLMTISLIGNIFGRYSLSKIAATTAVFTLVEAISLILFVKIITEGIYLQMEVGKININRISSYLDFKNLKSRIGVFLQFLAITLLIIFFTQNLSVFDQIYFESKQFLKEERNIGNTSFTFGGFILFIFIIYIATVIARIASYFFEFADEHAAKTSRRAKYSSSILLVRLFVWITGFLIAIAASGIPMDKITIILGALGVGIGFGLQNIVNNVVSGLVMVFEKPVQVGDLIEVGSETGTVKNIGLRASKILTLEGSEVIVPNGDLLSQNLINWTLSNTNKRICIDVGVAYGTDIDEVKEIFNNILAQNKDVMKTPAPLVILNDFGESAINFKILCWVADIDTWLLIKSVLMSSIWEEFYKKEIKIPFAQRDVNVYIKDAEVLKKVNENEAREEK